MEHLSWQNDRGLLYRYSSQISHVSTMMALGSYWPPSAPEIEERCGLEEHLAWIFCVWWKTPQIAAARTMVVGDPDTMPTKWPWKRSQDDVMFGEIDGTIVIGEGARLCGPMLYIVRKGRTGTQTLAKSIFSASGIGKQIVSPEWGQRPLITRTSL